MYRPFAEKLLLMTRNGLVFIPTNGVANGVANVLPKRPMELNSVKLMGTIVDDVRYLTNGIMKLQLKTVTEDNSNCVHNVTIANRNLLKLVQNKLVPEQRIYIGGKLQTQNSVVQEKHLREVEILANELFLLEPNPKIDDAPGIPMQMDGNSVEMLAFLGTSVKNERNFSAFSIVTHFTRQKGQSKESEDVEYHNVFIYKNPKLQRLADGLQKFDRIYLSGFVNYSTKMYEDGSEHENGFIQPINLVKLQKFNE